jgi:hypothetical protein
MNSTSAALLAALIYNLPQIATAAIGLVLIHTKLRRLHPRAHLYGGIGFALLLASGLLSVATRVAIPYVRQSYEPAAFAKALAITSLVGLVAFSASLILILVALLADRKPADPQVSDPR